MSWASQTVPDAQAEYEEAARDLEQLRQRVEAGTADPSSVTLAEYRLARAAKALTRVVTSNGDGAA